MSTDYSDKLRDPRWQKKRLEIFERDDWTCQSCFNSESTLVVHHRRYIADRDPWDYPDSLLITLCENCHGDERVNLRDASDSLIEQVQDKFFSFDIQTLAGGFNSFEVACYDSHVLSDVYAWALSDRDIQIELAERYFNHLKEIAKKVRVDSA